MHVILTECHQIPRHPLISVRSSLRSNSRDFHWSTQGNLQPLVSVADSRDPGPHVTASACAVESGEIRTVEHVEWRRGCHGGVLDFAALDANWSCAWSSWKRQCICVVNSVSQCLLDTRMTFVTLQVPAVAIRMSPRWFKLYQSKILYELVALSSPMSPHWLTWY